MAQLGLLLYTFMIGTFNSVLRAYALTCLWQWYVMTIFDVAPLGMVQAYGLALVVGLLTHQIPKPDTDDADITEQVVSVTVWTLTIAMFTTLCLGFGWLAVQLWPIEVTP